MTNAELQNWSEGQVQALMMFGVDGFDAEDTVKRVLAQLPEGADPDTWIPLASDQVEVGEAQVADARADYYANDAVIAQFKRLLDARERSGNG